MNYFIIASLHAIQLHFSSKCAYCSYCMIACLSQLQCMFTVSYAIP